MVLGKVPYLLILIRMKYQMTHLDGDKIKLVKGSSKTVALKMSPKSVETRRSWQKYQENLYKVISLEPRTKTDIRSEISSSEDEFSFEILRDEIDRIDREANDEERESSDEE